MATEKEFSYILSTPEVPGGKNYKTVLNVETGATVTYDVTAPFQQDAVLRSEPQIVNGKRIYVTQFIPDSNGKLPDGATGKYLSEIVAKEADKQRANFYKQENPKIGSELQIPGAINTSTTEEAGVGEIGVEIPTKIRDDEISTILGTSENLIYPTKLATNGQDFISFSLVKYGTREFQRTYSPQSGDNPNFSQGKRNLTQIIGPQVYLPIQPSINDQNDIGWGEDRMTPIQAYFANIATTGDFSRMGDDIEAIANLVGDKNSEYGKLLRRYIGGQAVGINPIARTNGLVLNPNLELLFSGPSLRPFNFTFRLSPRDSTEATTVKRIIKFFKYGSTVKTTNDGLFLKAPYVFNISYKYKNKEEHPGLNKIKTCALKTVTVNYTPDGSYMTFEDGTMTSYEISLQFMELEPVYDSDYKDNQSHPIGY